MTLNTILKKGFKKFKRQSWNSEYFWYLDVMGYIRSSSGNLPPQNVSKSNLLAKDWKPLNNKRK